MGGIPPRGNSGIPPRRMGVLEWFAGVPGEWVVSPPPRRIAGHCLPPGRLLRPRERKGDLWGMVGGSNSWGPRLSLPAHLFTLSVVPPAPPPRSFFPVVFVLSTLCVHSFFPPVQGFRRVVDNMADIELDSPGARLTFEEAVKTATAGGWLEEGFNPTPTTPSECVLGCVGGSCWRGGSDLPQPPPVVCLGCVGGVGSSGSTMPPCPVLSLAARWEPIGRLWGVQVAAALAAPCCCCCCLAKLAERNRLRMGCGPRMQAPLAPQASPTATSLSTPPSRWAAAGCGGGRERQALPRRCCRHSRAPLHPSPLCPHPEPAHHPNPVPHPAPVPHTALTPSPFPLALTQALLRPLPWESPGSASSLMGDAHPPPTPPSPPPSPTHPPWHRPSRPLPWTSPGSTSTPGTLWRLGAAWRSWMSLASTTSSSSMCVCLLFFLWGNVRQAGAWFFSVEHARVFSFFL